MSPEQIAWIHKKEQMEARKDFKEFTKRKVEELINEPKQYAKLMKKIA